MARTRNGKKRTGADKAASSPKEGRRAPKEKVIESGMGEQGGERLDPTAPEAGKREVAGKKEREDYRYGGIPIGSDPRE